MKPRCHFWVSTAGSLRLDFSAPRKCGRTCQCSDDGRGRRPEAAIDTIISPAWPNVTSSLSADSRLACKAPLRRIQMTPAHVHRHHPRRHVGPALQLADLRDDTGGRTRPDRVPPVDQLVAADHDRLAQVVDEHVLDQLVETRGRT